MKKKTPAVINVFDLCWTVVFFLAFSYVWSLVFGTPTWAVFEALAYTYGGILLVGCLFGFARLTFK